MFRRFKTRQSITILKYIFNMDTLAIKLIPAFIKYHSATSKSNKKGLSILIKSPKASIQYYLKGHTSWWNRCGH